MDIEKVNLGPSQVEEAKEACVTLLNEMEEIHSHLSENDQHRAKCWGCSAEAFMIATHKLHKDFVARLKAEPPSTGQKIGGEVTVPLDVFLSIARHICAEVLYDYDRFFSNPADATADFTTAAGPMSASPQKGEMKWH